MLLVFYDSTRSICFYDSKGSIGFNLYFLPEVLFVQAAFSPNNESE